MPCRLPICLLVDTSFAMAGGPMFFVARTIHKLLICRREDLFMPEIAHLSGVTFGGRAEQVVQLAELSAFKPPVLHESWDAGFAGALRLVAKMAKQEVRAMDAGQKADLRPYVFMFAAQVPTGAAWQQPWEEFRQFRWKNDILSPPSATCQDGARDHGLGGWSPGCLARNIVMRRSPVYEEQSCIAMQDEFGWILARSLACLDLDELPASGMFTWSENDLVPTEILPLPEPARMRHPTPLMDGLARGRRRAASSVPTQGGRTLLWQGMVRAWLRWFLCSCSSRRRKQCRGRPFGPCGSAWTASCRPCRLASRCAIGSS